MRGFACTLGIAILSFAAVAAGSGLPPEVTDQLEKVVAFDEMDDFVGSYRMTISSVVQKPNGKGREEELIEADLFLSRMVTDGLAAILLFKREFHIEIRFDDIRPATQQAD